MALPFPSSSPVEWTEEDGAFFSGVFDGSPENALAMTWDQPDFKSPRSASFDDEENDNTPSAVTGEPPGFVTEAQENDIICMRGAGQGHPGNKHYHCMIQSNKKIYDTMTIEDKEAFSEQLWVSLRDERGARFLKPTEHNPKVYEVLDHERSVRKISECVQSFASTCRWSNIFLSFLNMFSFSGKILFALRDCRLKGKLKVSSVVAESKQKAQGKQVKGKHRFGSVEQGCSRGPKFVDDEAATEISTLYQNNVLIEEMKKSWKKDFEAKKMLFENHVSICKVLMLVLKVSQPLWFYVTKSYCTDTGQLHCKEYLPKHSRADLSMFY
jgi:hypothetical protein